MKQCKEMDEKIVQLLRMSDNPTCLYAANRIEILEKKLEISVHIIRYGEGFSPGETNALMEKEIGDDNEA